MKTQPKIHFGNTERTTVIDELGSTKVEQFNFAEGKKKLAKVKYNIYHRTDRVSITDLEVMLDSLKQDKQKLQCEVLLKIPDDKKHFIIIEQFTLLEIS